MKKKLVAMLVAMALVVSSFSAALAANGDGTGGGSGSDTNWGPYTSWQGQADTTGVWMTTPDASLVETAGKISKPNEAIHNRITLEYDADQAIVMAFDISGDGSNNFTTEMLAGKVGVYSKLRCTKEDLVLADDQLNLVKTGARKGDQAVDSRNGSNIELTIPAKSLEAGTTYYLNLAEDFGIVDKQGDVLAIGTRIVFQFSTKAENLPVSVDKTKLEKQLVRADAIDKTLYTEASLEEVKAEKKNAKEVLEDANASQEDVDAASQFLKAAIDGLVYNAKGQLSLAVEEAKAIRSDLYTEESYEALAKAIKEGEAVLVNAEASESDYTAAKKAIDTAKASLVSGGASDLDSYSLSEYTDWQGSSAAENAIGLYLVSPGAKTGNKVKTAGRVPFKAGYVWYNVIEKDLQGQVDFELYITGNGIKNLPLDGSSTLPYMHIYKDKNLTKEVLGEDGKSLIVFDEISELAQGENYPGFEADSRPGKLLKVHVKENSLETGKKYYLVLDKDFHLNTTDRCLVDPIVFRFVCHEHEYVEKITKASTSKDGKLVMKCSCGQIKSTKTIKHIGKVSLSALKYTYDGESKKPVVTVKDYKDNTISSKYYTVKYEAGRKKVGTYKVSITFKGRYKGSVTKSFKINPKGTSLKSLTPKTGALAVKWTKRTTEVTGYQIRYATKSSMEDGKTLTVKSATTVSKTISKLKKGKKYYVQIRTYKTVGDVKYYSAWSGSKSAPTKK